MVMLHAPIVFFAVVDFCLTKNLETDGETNYQRLTLQWASKASLTQRKGERYCENKQINS